MQGSISEVAPTKKSEGLKQDGASSPEPLSRQSHLPFGEEESDLYMAHMGSLGSGMVLTKKPDPIQSGFVLVGASRPEECKSKPRSASQNRGFLTTNARQGTGDHFRSKLQEVWR
mmetsp:Transcript_74141/g.162284  ORF Transcript_74141/g.162284 Transcript_74141/m.162284 type:complete len:115 (+) Transcript_74141:201-545(+)